MPSTHLKYSKRLSAVVAASAAALTLSSASAAIAIVSPNQTLPWGPAGGGWMSFTPTGASWVNYSSSSHMANIRNCSLNLISNHANFQWTASAISEGTVVNELLSYRTTAGGSFSYPADGEIVYAGYRVLNQGANQDETYYGYVRIVGGENRSFTVDRYSYETSPNTGITAIPEPSATLLWIAGAGFAFTRRRRA